MNELFFIAELSANHNNDINIALKTIRAIGETGAHAVKVQTYTADSLVLDVQNEYFGARKEGLWKGRTLYELYEEGSLPYEWHAQLKEETENLGMKFFSSPFAIKDVDFLEKLGVPLYKIASFEINDIPLIEYVASKGKPIILSTGVATFEDIELAVSACRKQGNTNITLLKCTSEYPAEISDANLLSIPDMKKRFNVNVGISDHTMGSIVPITSVALGATVIEKHVILDRKMGGIDSAFSMEPKEFGRMVEDCKSAYTALGKISYEQLDKNKFRRRSLFVSKDIRKGEILTAENIKSVRPGNGLHPKYYHKVIGMKATKELKKGEPLNMKFLF